MADASPETIQGLIDNSEKGLSQIEMSLTNILETRQAVVMAIEKEQERNVHSEQTLIIMDSLLAENEIIYDAFASLDALLKTTDDYTKRYFMQSLNLCFWETCQLFVGEDGDEDGLLSRMEKLTKELNQAGCQYILRHIIDDVHAFRANYADRELRNITRHYDDPIRMYEKQQKLNDIDFFAKGASELIAIRMEMTVVSSYLLNLIVPNKSQSPDAVSTLKCGFDPRGLLNDVMFKSLKEKGLNSEVHSVLEKGQSSLDECYRQYCACSKAVDFLKKKGCQNLEAFYKLKVLIALRMETLFLRYDLACSIWGYLNASSDKGRSQNLRLIHITKQAALTHIYGYNEKAKDRSLWTKIKQLEEANEGRLNTDKVENSLKKLTGNLNVDKENSQIFAHYRYKGNFYIPARLEAFNKMVHYDELTDSLELLNVCKELESFTVELLSCMNEKQKQERKKQHDEWIGKIDNLIVKDGEDEGITETWNPMRELIDSIYLDKKSKSN